MNVCNTLSAYIEKIRCGVQLLLWAHSTKNTWTWETYVAAPTLLAMVIENRDVAVIWCVVIFVNCFIIGIVIRPPPMPQRAPRLPAKIVNIAGVKSRDALIHMSYVRNRRTDYRQRHQQEQWWIRICFHAYFLHKSFSCEQEILSGHYGPWHPCTTRGTGEHGKARSPFPFFLIMKPSIFEPIKII